MTSSSETSEGEGERTSSVASSPSDTANLAFLVHSQDSVRGSLPPDVDNKTLVRQKRRRTSPEDQKILEEEYQRNPKPDKATRLDIVSRVALGEKEVQIWFQNRRQSTRRKTLSFGAEEIMPLSSQSSEKPNSPSDDTSPDEQCGQMENGASSTNAQESEEENDASLPKSAAVEQPDENHKPTNDGNEEPGLDSQSTVQSFSATSFIEASTQETAPTQVHSSQELLSSQEMLRTSSAGPGYLANRRSASFIKYQEQQPVSDLPTSPAPAKAKRGLNRTNSYLRLSMSDDGHALVIDRAAKSPSPQKLAETVPRAAGLRRSFSAAGLHDRFGGTAGAELVHKYPRTSAMPGRSRDSRAWEFWCDTDARNSLASKADSEVSGSAADAIGQIVATHKALRANSSKRNMPLAAQNAVSRKSNPQGKPAKPVLQRASTSNARLQNKPFNQESQVNETKKKNSGDTEEWEHVTTESDKENWEPETRPHLHTQSPRGPQHTNHTARRVLGENTQMLSQGSSLGAMMARDKRGKRVAEKNFEILDDEVAQFMGGSDHAANKRASTSSGEDLDCVQSLLSLSQGNWR